MFPKPPLMGRRGLDKRLHSRLISLSLCRALRPQESSSCLRPLRLTSTTSAFQMPIPAIGRFTLEKKLTDDNSVVSTRCLCKSRGLKRGLSAAQMALWGTEPFRKVIKQTSGQTFCFISSIQNRKKQLKEKLQRHGILVVYTYDLR